MQAKSNYTKKASEFVAVKLKALGHPVRLCILDTVKHSGKNVADIQAAVSAAMRKKQSQSAISQHLSVLKIQGLIESQTRGVERHYRQTKEGLSQLQAVFSSLLPQEVAV